MYSRKWLLYAANDISPEYSPEPCSQLKVMHTYSKAVAAATLQASQKVSYQETLIVVRNIASESPALICERKATCVAACVVLQALRSVNEAP